MSTRTPPRYLPTLTEVVDPSLLQGAAVSAASAALDAAVAAPSRTVPRATEMASGVLGAMPAPAAPDRQALAQQLIKLVKPQLEAELRSLAQELFEAQFSALLPNLHLHIEEAMREALEQALPPLDASQR